ncbi:hypothetical protein [Actinophytocola sediminis]
MNTRVATVVGALAIALGGIITSTSVASASAEQFHCDPFEYLVGSQGHHGAAISCHGAPFTGVIDCRIVESGYIYRHFGNRAGDGQVSTTWCGLGAEVVFAGGTPS